MKTSIDPEKCIGCGLCVQIASSVFEMSGDKAIVITDEVPDDAAGDARDAADQCPVDAIGISA